MATEIAFFPLWSDNQTSPGYRFYRIDHPSGSVFKWAWDESDGETMFESGIFKTFVEVLEDAVLDARQNLNDPIESAGLVGDLKRRIAFEEYLDTSVALGED